MVDSNACIAWRLFHLNWIPVAAMGAVLAVLYLPVLSKLVYNWWADPDYSHAFVVVPLALFLIWQRRAEINEL